jgi:hypothetical protein
VKVCSFRYDGKIEDLFHFSESYPNMKNTVSCYLNDLVFVWGISDKDSKNKQIFLLDSGAAQNTTAYQVNMDAVSELKRRCTKLDPEHMMVNISRTASHHLRKGGTAIDAVVDHNFKSDVWKVDVAYEGGCFFFDYIHSVKNGFGTRDRAQLPSLESLENLIEVLEAIQDGK